MAVQHYAGIDGTIDIIFRKRNRLNIFVIGTDQHDLHQYDPRNIFQISKTCDLNQTIELLRANIGIDILYLGPDVDNEQAIKYYNGMLNPEAMIIANNLPDTSFLSELLGQYKAYNSEENKHIIGKIDNINCDKFAIVIATYYRSDGRSNFYVRRALKHIAQQSYQEFKVFLIGDNYTNHEEFEQFRHLLPEKQLCCVNLPMAWERENCKVRRNLWAIAGANAMNYGLALARKENFKYYAHLDDDDYWYRHHLHLMIKAYKSFKQAYFVCNVGIMTNGRILPHHNGQLAYNNFKCCEAAAFHSSYSLDLSVFDFKYNTLDLDKPETEYIAADADLLNRIARKCHAKNLKYIAVPVITCFHDYENTVLNGHPNLVSNKHPTLQRLQREMLLSRSDLRYNYISKVIRTFHHHNHILYDLRTMLGNRPINYLEIGSFYGASLSLLAGHPYPTNLHSIDIFQFDGQEEALKQNVDKFNHRDRSLTVYNSNSQAPELLTTLRRQNFTTDLLFIDGDHSYQGVMLDYKNFEQFVNVGGFIVFDDYHDSECSAEVKVAVDQIVAQIEKEDNPKYEIVGFLPNLLGVHPAKITQYNEFIIQRKY